MKVWLTNDIVAWEIPPRRIASFFLRKAYLPPEGWQVKQAPLGLDWHRGELGEMRRELVGVGRKR